MEFLSLSIRGQGRHIFLVLLVLLGDTYLDHRGEVGRPGNGTPSILNGFWEKRQSLETDYTPHLE